MATNGRAFNSRRLFLLDKISKKHFLIDTGADLSVIPSNWFIDIKINPDIILTAANGSIIKTYGTKLLKLDFGLRKEFVFPFIIASVYKPIIGADFLVKFGLMVDLKNKQLVDNTTSLSISCLFKETDCPTPKFFEINSKYGLLLKEFPSLFAEPNYKLPTKHNVVHRIFTEGQLPICRPRRLNSEKHKIAKTEFEHMLQLGIIEPSSSQVSSPLHMVPKKNFLRLASLW